MLHQVRNPRFYAMLVCDTVFFIIACVTAYLLRFDFQLASSNLTQIAMLLPLAIPAKLVIFSFAGMYRGMWRFFGMHDFWRLFQASILSSLFVIGLVLFFYGHSGFSRGVLLLDGLLTFLLTGGSRVLIRSFYAAKTGPQGAGAFSLPRFGNGRKHYKRVLIIGAGGSGEKILREITDNPYLEYEVVGFLDDAPGKIGRTLHNVRVLGNVEELPLVLEAHSVDQVFISAPSATGAQMRRIVEVCKSCNVSFKTLPGIGQILDGKVSIKALRDVNYEDLLRRPPVKLDTAGIMDYVSGRTVLVTGAGGSIGSELCRQLVRFEPGKLILLDAGESNLYSIHMELRHELKFDKYHCILSRVQNRPLMDNVFDKYRPDIVFHAAAYKHVPMLERNPWEAVFNNVLGSQVTMETAARHGVGRFVLVSTDKAVRPTNVMGTTKRLTELILLSMQDHGTRFMAVRFGNVIASSGSVIPLFLRQIEQGGPVTVTHEEVTRYFMTIPEASQLILQAGALGEGGEVFVLEMGTPVKIAEMANDLIRLSGKEPGRDIEIVYTGLRAGEKLYEELITKGEDVTSTRHEKIMVLHSNGNWNGNGQNSRDDFRRWLDRHLGELYSVAETHDSCLIKRKLRDLVPEYAPQEAECVL